MWGSKQVKQSCTVFYKWQFNGEAERLENCFKKRTSFSLTSLTDADSFDFISENNV